MIEQRWSQLADASQPDCASPCDYLPQMIFAVKINSHNKLITRESNLHFTPDFTVVIFFNRYELAKVIRRND